VIFIFSDILSFISMIFAVIVILYLSYVVSRKLGGTVMNHSMSKNIHVIDTVFLGRDKRLSFRCLSGKYKLIKRAGGRPGKYRYEWE